MMKMMLRIAVLSKHGLCEVAAWEDGFSDGVSGLLVL
jgi:hypothetical protein